MSTATIEFDVGGTPYKVSKSLVEQYPNSMLAAISSKRWKNDQDEEGDEGAIFIDRNGERFQYVLDYMRDSKVCLPLSIPKVQFLTDMEYYGLDVDDKNVKLSVTDSDDMFYTLGNIRDHFNDLIREAELRYSDVAAEMFACVVAREFFFKLLDTNRWSSGWYPTIQQPCQVQVSYDQKQRHLTVNYIQVHLRKFGLKATQINFPQWQSDKKCQCTVFVSLL
ncbi:BTB/POZ domain containing protein [Nitzschia inconspicua]|uniref:BTB/POZ domain containing protein n=1 Tax=Nitzschia inconspicua TaxID=303405 RepID=A0A9K3KGE6_9STRA|nr:BTB/POZ domain containing protein [Nitzschia inconspicua]